MGQHQGAPQPVRGDEEGQKVLLQREERVVERESRLPPREDAQASEHAKELQETQETDESNRLEPRLGLIDAVVVEEEQRELERKDGDDVDEEPRPEIVHEDALATVHLLSLGVEVHRVHLHQDVEEKHEIHETVDGEERDAGRRIDVGLQETQLEGSDDGDEEQQRGGQEVPSPVEPRVLLQDAGGVQPRAEVLVPSLGVLHARFTPRLLQFPRPLGVRGIRLPQLCGDASLRLCECVCRGLASLLLPPLRRALRAVLHALETHREALLRAAPLTFVTLRSRGIVAGADRRHARGVRGAVLRLVPGGGVSIHGVAAPVRVVLMAGLVRGAVPRGAGDAIARVPRIVAAIKIVILWSRGAGDVSRLRREGRRRRSRSTQRVRSRRRRVTFPSEKAGVRRARGRPRRRARAHLVPDHVSHVAGARHDPQKARGRDHPVRRARGLWHLHTCVSTLYRVKHSTSPPRVRLFGYRYNFLVHEPRNTCSSR